MTDPNDMEDPQAMKKCSAMIYRGEKDIFTWEFIGTPQGFRDECAKYGYSICSPIKEESIEDPEDPQAGEILPPILYEDLYENCLEHCLDPMYDFSSGIKMGYELCFKKLLTHMQAALPYFEAGVRDTRLDQADAGKLAELATFKEIVNYVR